MNAAFIRISCFCSLILFVPAISWCQTSEYEISEYPFGYYNQSSGEIVFNNLDILNNSTLAYVALESPDGSLIASNAQDISGTRIQGFRTEYNLAWWKSIEYGGWFQNNSYAGNVIEPGTPISDLTMKYGVLSGGFSTTRGFDFPALSVVSAPLYLVPEPGAVFLLGCGLFGLLRRPEKSNFHSRP